MIYSIKGTIQLIEQNLVVIESGGVGFAVKTSMNTLSRLPKQGEQAIVYTYLHVKEDILDLYGFASKEELESFKLLISISGVGPKAAISILSDLSPEAFALAVASGDAKTLTKAQGIGLKTAQRIVLELKDKVSKTQVAAGVTGGSVQSFAISGNTSEAISALVVLGYSQSDATAIITRLSPELSVEDMIKEGLKALSTKFE